MATLGVVECPKSDGTCYVPETSSGRALTADSGVLAEVPRAEIERLLRRERPEGPRWQEVNVRQVAPASAGVDDPQAGSQVQIIGDGGDEANGIYVKCQPCGHHWIKQT